MPAAPERIVDFYLQPGELQFADSTTRIRTVLGSCVAVTMWHPLRCIGGMCHFMLPTRVAKAGAEPNGRYGDEAIAMLFDEAARRGTRPGEYRYKIFGGGRMFPRQQEERPCLHRPCAEVVDDCRLVSCKNAAQGLALLTAAGLTVDAHDLGGTASRNVILELWSGTVLVRKGEPQLAVLAAA